jgi:hypothetical protein
VDEIIAHWLCLARHALSQMLNPSICGPHFDKNLGRRLAGSTASAPTGIRLRDGVQAPCSRWATVFALRRTSDRIGQSNGTESGAEDYAPPGSALSRVCLVHSLRDDSVRGKPAAPSGHVPSDAGRTLLEAPGREQRIMGAGPVPGIGSAAAPPGNSPGRFGTR